MNLFTNVPARVSILVRLLANTLDYKPSTKDQGYEVVPWDFVPFAGYIVRGTYKLKETTEKTYFSLAWSLLRENTDVVTGKVSLVEVSKQNKYQEFSVAECKLLTPVELSDLFTLDISIMGAIHRFHMVAGGTQSDAYLLANGAEISHLAGIRRVVDGALAYPSSGTWVAKLQSD